MDYVKRAVWGPDPREQQRTVRSALRKNTRSLDRSLRDLAALRDKTKILIRNAARKGDVGATRTYAREMYGIEKQYTRMSTSKAQLESVGMRVDEAFRTKELTRQMGQSADLMRDVNSLIRLPAIRSTMTELERELVRAGLMEELVDDVMEPEEEDLSIEDDEVERIIAEITGERLQTVKAPMEPLQAAEPLSEPVSIPAQNEEPSESVEDDADRLITDMRERLRALQN